MEAARYCGEQCRLCLAYPPELEVPDTCRDCFLLSCDYSGTGGAGAEQLLPRGVEPGFGEGKDGDGADTRGDTSCTDGSRRGVD